MVAICKWTWCHPLEQGKMSSSHTPEDKWPETRAISHDSTGLAVVQVDLGSLVSRLYMVHSS